MLLSFFKDYHIFQTLQQEAKNIEKGVMPWKMPWTSAGALKNFLTKKKYQGINCFILLDHDFSVNLWGHLSKSLKMAEK